MNLLKKILLASAGLCITTSAFAAYNITNITTTNICVNNISTDILYSAILNSTPGGNVNITVYFGDGQSETYSNLTTKSINGSHTYELKGKYKMKIVVSSNGTKESEYIQNIDAFCQYVNLTTFYDQNNDCVWNTSEIKLPENTEVEVEKDGVFQDRIFLGDAYTYPVEENKNYTFKFLQSSLGAFTACMNNKERTLSPVAGYTKSDMQLGINCGGINKQDLNAYVYSRIRVISTSYITLYCQNLSCNSKNVQATLTIDPRFDYVWASVPHASVKNNVVTWNLSDLSILKNQRIVVAVNPKPGANLAVGMKAYSTLKMTPETDDLNIADNNYEDTTIIIGSWDPNDISVSPGGYIVAGQKLDYTINFENLGSDTAFNVHILDTLSEYYDTKSFRLISSSHPVNAGIVDGNNGVRIARFDFPNINLADSTDKNNNKGYVRFSINTKSTLPANTTIDNRAGIYFDINPVVMTNTAQNIIAPLGINAISTEDNIKVYPNPARDVVYVQTTTDAYTHAELMNSIGQCITKTTIQKGTNIISTAQLAPGIYNLLLHGIDGTKAIKVEKQ